MRCDVMDCPEEATFAVEIRGKEVIVVLEADPSEALNELCDGHYHRLRAGSELAIQPARARQHSPQD